MLAELGATLVKAIRMAGTQHRLAEVNHLRPRGISSNPGRGSNISQSRSMISNLRTSVKAVTDMMMEIRPWRGPDMVE